MEQCDTTRLAMQDRTLKYSISSWPVIWVPLISFTIRLPVARRDDTNCCTYVWKFSSMSEIERSKNVRLTQLHHPCLTWCGNQCMAASYDLSEFCTKRSWVTNNWLVVQCSKYSNRETVQIIQRETHELNKTESWHINIFTRRFILHHSVHCLLERTVKIIFSWANKIINNNSMTTMQSLECSTRSVSVVSTQ